MIIDILASEKVWEKVAVFHREIKEERKTGKIIGEIKIGPKMYYCAGAALNVVFHHFLN